MSAAHYSKNPRLRLRPYEPWHAAMAYTPDKPALHWLNSTSWLVLELCQGTTPAEISAAIADALPGRAAQADEIARECLRDLLDKGLIRQGEEQWAEP